MENKTLIPKKEFIKGFYLQMECCMCRSERTFAEDTKKELYAIIKNSGWKNLSSDMYQVEGWYCGCDYKD